MKIISQQHGREGSDYTAAILPIAWMLTASPSGKMFPVMNADPRYFENASLLNQILSWGYWISLYGATVIHPKHYNPYKEEIPLCKVLYQPVVRDKCCRGVNLEPYLPCFIVKRNQLLISLSSIDFSFIMEENISEIFSLFHEFKLKVNLIQNTAISFSVRRR
jgi:aspartate kinase